jgi:hypothetical protein
MIDKRKMSLIPPKVKDDDKLKEFIEEPEKRLQDEKSSPPDGNKGEIQKEPVKKVKRTKRTDFPWDAPGITPEIIKPFILRLKQPDKLKAEYIVKNSLEYKSLQEFFMKAILRQVDKDLKKLKQ